MLLFIRADDEYDTSVRKGLETFCVFYVLWLTAIGPILHGN